MFSRQKLIPTPSYVWPTSPEPDGGVATAVVLSPAGMGARAPLGSIPRLQLHAMARNCLGRCQVHIHRSRFRGRGATSIHTHSQEGAPWSSQFKNTHTQKLYFLATGSSRCRVRQSSMDGTIPNSDSAHKDLLSRLYLTQSDEVQYGIYFDLILYRVQFGQRSFIFPAKKIRVSDQIECTDLV
jgi:hypothetical protein